MSGLTPLLHSVPNACERMGIGRTTMYELIGAGDVKPVKIGHKTLIPETELQKLVAALEEARHE